MLVSAILSTGLTSVFSLVYISQIFVYAPALVVPSLIITLVTVAFSVISAFVQMKISKREMELSSKESGMSYALISGVQKIKLSGAEKRAFARWGNLYAQQARLSYNPPTFIKINGVISTAISLVGALVMYYFAVSSGVSVADYYAFNTAYGMVSGAFMSLAGIALTVAQIKPIMDMVKPILDAVPEISEGKQMITRLSGGIELNNVSFRYNENMPLVVDNLSLKIRPGQYVAIVGATGCGKSTLMRLMLGFETPQKGAVYFDGKDISSVDLKSLRRNIGTVMQNGKLFSGDIFSNITISAPWLTMDDAWHAAELSGIADDIRRMPMGMHTIISEGSGGVSGGQRQRLMIARAIAPKPRILMFDEATSALDNLTQKTVSESLDSLKCTRIVIAHRLSTIKQCDRIIVLDKGRIIEDGKYDELIEKDGFFAELVARQRLDDTAKTRA
ncbi:MAG: ATP-binding cassette domain-containing protein, partial [Oscillospiraceae bacterium]|nr:ATP-binding cassette domain-containing protein [Oscillospiraceae bacterium]